MTEMYIVISSGGEYIESWETASVVSSDKSKLEEWIRNEQANITSRNADVEKYNAANKIFREASGPIPHTPRIPIPKWEAGLSNDQIPDVMRTERTKIQLLNKRIDDVNTEHMDEYRNRCDEFSSMFFLALGYSKDDPFVNRSHYLAREIEEVYYKIETIEVI